MRQSAGQVVVCAIFLPDPGSCATAWSESVAQWHLQGCIPASGRPGRSQAKNRQVSGGEGDRRDGGAADRVPRKDLIWAAVWRYRTRGSCTRGSGGHASPVRARSLVLDHPLTAGGTLRLRSMARETELSMRLRHPEIKTTRAISVGRATTSNCSRARSKQSDSKSRQ